MIREDFLQQNAFMDVDGYSSYDRQEKLLAMILRLRPAVPGRHRQGRGRGRALRHPRPGEDGPGQERAGRPSTPQVYADIAPEMEQEIAAIAAQGGEDA